MRNGPQQQANVGGAFEVDGEPPTSPVLLIDDLVDSRWTLTEVAAVLPPGRERTGVPGGYGQRVRQLS